MRKGSIYPYYVAFVFSLALCLYTDQETKSLQVSWREGNKVNKTLGNFTSGGSTATLHSFTQPFVIPPRKPQWRDIVLEGIGDNQVNYNELEQIRQAIVRDRIESHNQLMKIQNEHLIDDGKWNGISIVVQVHNRLQLFQVLLESIKSVKSVENSLLIISMDTTNSEIEVEIQNINFIAVLTIYHPFSMEFYTNQYPNTDPKDCTRDQKNDYDNCNSAALKDSYGHFREAKFSQIKTHWTWKLNFIYTKIEKYNIDKVILLEEDHFLAVDALYLATKFIWPKVEECENSSKICLGSLGTYIKARVTLAVNDALLQTLWISGTHNMGMVITKKWFDELKSKSFPFCFHDDYNWDFSLMKISKDKNWQVYMPLIPRVYHLGGECGYHAKKTNCDVKHVKDSAQAIIAKWENKQFPESLRISATVKKFPVGFKAYGGWGDIRDRRLCLLYFNELKGPLLNL